MTRCGGGGKSRASRAPIMASLSQQGLEAVRGRKVSSAPHPLTLRIGVRHMYAIIEESGGQRKVEAGEEMLIDLIDGGAAAAGKVLTFDKVLLISGKDGAAARLGAPYVAGATVTAEVVTPVVKGEKIEIWKFRAKKNFRRHTGHRHR